MKFSAFRSPALLVTCRSALAAGVLFAASALFAASDIPRLPDGTPERYTRTPADTLEIEVTIDDPGAYAKPFTTSGSATLRPGEDLLEYICNENNIDLQHIDAPARLP